MPGDTGRPSLSPTPAAGAERCAIRGARADWAVPPRAPPGPRRVIPRYGIPHDPSPPPPPRAMNEHLRFLLVLFLGVVALLVGRETYRWFRYADERNALLAMEPVIRQAGAEAVATRTETDSLRARVDSLNRDLDRRGEGLRRYGRIAVNGLLPPDVYQRYAADRREYERVLALREERYAAWKNAYDRNRSAVRLYTALADSMRAVSQRMGDPYFHVITPVEAYIARDSARAALRAPR